MRKAFIQELVTLARLYPHIALLVGDLGYSVVEPFADEFPDRFINVGVAEQNMTGIAAGMASEGYHVFTYSIANFPTFRCAEQIRNDVSYHNLPVTIVCVGGGLAYGALGYSHHAIQDYALMRCMPNMLIAAPGDPMEVRACMRHLVANPRPSYLRLGKTGEPCIHEFPPQVEPGVWLKVVNGDQNECLLTTGAMLESAIKYHRIGSPQVPSVYSMPLWGMPFKEMQAEQLKKFLSVTTLEDHLQDGGFGSWLMESVSGHHGLADRLQSKSLSPNVCGMVGSQASLSKAAGLS